VSVLLVLIGGPEDGREFRVPDDDPIATSGVLALPEPGAPTSAHLGAATFAQLRYRWDGTVRGDGARRFRMDG
jgi:hypothetical protein